MDNIGKRERMEFQNELSHLKLKQDIDILEENAVYCLPIVLERIMERRNISQADICKSIGLPSSTLNDWTIGKRPRDYNALYKVAKFLNISFMYLVFGEKSDQEKYSRELKKLQLENEMLNLEKMKQLDLFKCKDDQINELKTEINRLQNLEAV